MAQEPDPWVEALKAREPEAVRKLWDEFSGPVRRYLLGMLRHPADAEDLAQETLVRLLQHAGDFRGGASLKTYLFQIAHNLALNHLASAPARRESYTGELPEWKASPEPGAFERVAAGQEARRVRAALETLPPQQRAVVILRAWEELSFKEIARALGLAEGTAKAHYFFALRNLRRRMEEPDGP